MSEISESPSESEYARERSPKKRRPSRYDSDEEETLPRDRRALLPDHGGFHRDGFGPQQMPDFPKHIHYPPGTFDRPIPPNVQPPAPVSYIALKDIPNAATGPTQYTIGATQILGLFLTGLIVCGLAYLFLREKRSKKLKKKRGTQDSSSDDYSVSAFAYVPHP